ncbi:sulfatase-like hydrolase/transferase [Promicromonospora sp. NPDC090134]|uniref:sulfatase-like hydrolase/transferase n=1 Tax=Promicromonospora sp. NPDC090134 TaxID=3364408 RepID=UPI00382B707D
MDSADPSARSHLPIPNRVRSRVLPYTVKDEDSTFEPIATETPPEGAPNVLVILLDDVGFGASSAFGGPCQMPTAERLAASGLKYSRFHTTALCSPTRAALLSGRNHHAVAMGGITEMATSAPGYTSVRPNDCAPVTETLRLNGYATAHIGKCHEVPVWETSPAGPFDRWPSPGNGFQHFYGFIAGETNQWYPALYSDTTPVEPWGTPEDGYHLMPDLADHAIGWVQQQKALTPEQPFFMYFAPGATHEPHHVPKEWIEKYRGEFDRGWDVQREETFARQKELGVIPADAVLTERHDEIPAWDDMDEALKPVLARQMEVYAAFLEYADHHTGRLIDALERQGVLENTLVFYIIGDNGASAEGTITGCYNAAGIVNGPGLETTDYLLERIDELGGPKAYNHYAVGWAHAMDTPYQWTKQVASHWGGTRNGTIVHWPAGISARGDVRPQFCHVTDVAPTILDVAGLPEPISVNGVQQEPMHGQSMRYSFDEATAPERHTTQYFEMFVNRGIYHNGWSAVTKHRTPWAAGVAKVQDISDDVWELYDGSTDWTQAHDLAAEHPEKLEELQRLFLLEANRYNVFPLDDRVWERLNADIAGRPSLVVGSTQTLFPGMGRLNENCVVNTRNRSHSVTAEVTIPDAGADGVILNQGGTTGGWSLYVKNGRLTYAYSFCGFEITHIAAAKSLESGEHQVRAEITYDGGGLGKGTDVTLFVDGEPVGTGRVERTHPLSFSLDETTDVGVDTGAPVTSDYPIGRANAFRGDIAWVRIDIGDDSHDHHIDPADIYRVAMIKQ